MRPDQATTREVPSLNPASMLKAMTQGVAETLRNYRAQGVSVITWNPETEQIVETPADQIPAWIDEPSSTDPAASN